ncbi:UNVERIFIED_CONTAM: hypothetical protein K2H54_061027 [Gekko kuhli]
MHANSDWLHRHLSQGLSPTLEGRFGCSSRSSPWAAATEVLGHPPTTGDEALGHLAAAAMAEVLAWTAAATTSAPEEAWGWEVVVVDRPLGHPVAPVIPALARATAMAADDMQAQVPALAEEVLGHPVPVAAQMWGHSAAVVATEVLAQLASAEEEALGHLVSAVA